MYFIFSPVVLKEIYHDWIFFPTEQMEMTDLCWQPPKHVLLGSPSTWNQGKKGSPLTVSLKNRVTEFWKQAVLH